MTCQFCLDCTPMLMGPLASSDVWYLEVRLLVYTFSIFPSTFRLFKAPVSWGKKDMICKSCQTRIEHILWDAFLFFGRNPCVTRSVKSVQISFEQCIRLFKGPHHHFSLSFLRASDWKFLAAILIVLHVIVISTPLFSSMQNLLFPDQLACRTADR